jgi:hypothetical protein
MRSGEFAVLGDSREEAAIISRHLPVSAINLGGPGAGPLETAYIAEQVIRCPNRPRRVLLSLNMTTFTQMNQTWDLSIRNGFMPCDTVWTIQRIANGLRDPSFDDAPSVDQLPHTLRPWAYCIRFPPIFLGSLLNGLLKGREARNEAILSRTVADRGYLLFGEQETWDGVAADAHVTMFRPLPILNAFFERTVRTLLDAGVEIYFALTPVNDATYDAMSPMVREAFIAYLSDFQSRYQSFHLLQDRIPRWPAAYFGDAGLHLNARGAEVLTSQWATCLRNVPDRETVSRDRCPLGQTPDASSVVAVPEPRT